MSRGRALSHFNSLETLEIKLMPNAGRVSELVATTATLAVASAQSGDDAHLPNRSPRLLPILVTIPPTRYCRQWDQQARACDFVQRPLSDP